MALLCEAYIPTENNEKLQMFSLLACHEFKHFEMEQSLKRKIEELEGDLRKKEAELEEKNAEVEYCRTALSDRRSPTACRRCKERKTRV